MSISNTMKSLSPFRILGKKLVHKDDEYGSITVIEKNKYFILTFDMIYEQSKILKASPMVPVHHYIRAMLMALAFTPVNKVLVLGLGGGCLVRAVNAYNNEAAMDVVELRAAVLSIGYEYFSLPANALTHYYVQDANNFINHENNSLYDLIFSDLYSEDEMSPLQSKGSFLVSCADRLTLNGWLVMNYHIRPDASSVFSHALHELFKTVLYCTTQSGNVIIYASKMDYPLPLSKYQELGNSIGEILNCEVRSLAEKISFWPKLI